MNVKSSASLCTIVLCGLLVSAVSATAQVDAKAVYDRWCAGCHAEDGTGAGPGANQMRPPPRDFTLGLYQIRSTATGELPTDADILNSINVGMPGTAMPGWEDVLSSDEREALVEYLKAFSRFFANSPPPEPLDFGSAPRGSDERVTEGREVYDRVECSRCHGEEGRGDGESASTLADNDDLPIASADLTKNWMLNGGGTVEDIYRRLRTGLDGTPMPNISDLVDAGVITDDELWSLAHYVRSLSPETTPAVREVILAELVVQGAELPSTVDDERWTDVDRFYIPMVGQIVLEPRWFSPRVEGLWVQAMHDGSELAMLVSWSDPSSSPDPDWADYANKVVAVMASTDEGSTTGPGPADELIVQFPQTQPTGMARPFFLQGDLRRPTYLWTWRSDETAPVESMARGMGTAQAQPTTGQDVTAVAAHGQGQWKVLMRRALDTEDPEDLPFSVGAVTPVAFQAFDGDNGEQGMQGSVSTWYFVSLQQKIPVTAYVAPFAALFLTFGFGLLVVSQAKKGEEKRDGNDEAARPTE